MIDFIWKALFASGLLLIISTLVHGIMDKAEKFDLVTQIAVALITGVLIGGFLTWLNRLR